MKLRVGPQPTTSEVKVRRNETANGAPLRSVRLGTAVQTKSLTAPASPCIAIVGLGFVGLELAVAFGRVLPTIGFDVDAGRIRDLRDRCDRNGEVVPDELRTPTLQFMYNPEALAEADIFIVAVPTPVDRTKRPDLSCLIDASRLVAHSLKIRHMKSGKHCRRPIVVYESTVYPGCTEETCLPVLERESGLRVGREFGLGYSPERINPGDGEHGLGHVVKVVSAQDSETLNVLARVYGMVTGAGICRAPNIRTAEAAKVIENVQRDLNIALMNEMAMLFHRLGLSTQEVLRVARSKWNFLPFEPGLVGGHCIPVDPYYLTYKAQEVGYHPDVILAGRRINDSMGLYVAGQVIKLLIQVGKMVRGARILVLGVTFKEDVVDTRNSRVMDLVRELETYGCHVHVHDPVVSEDSLAQFSTRTVGDPFRARNRYDVVLLAVPHRGFRQRRMEAYVTLLEDEGGPGILVDVKRVLLRDSALPSNIVYWSL